jgi:hypothetical protein
VAGIKPGIFFFVNYIGQQTKRIASHETNIWSNQILSPKSETPDAFAGIINLPHKGMVKGKKKKFSSENPKPCTSLICSTLPVQLKQFKKKKKKPRM